MAYIPRKLTAAFPLVAVALVAGCVDDAERAEASAHGPRHAQSAPVATHVTDTVPPPERLASLVEALEGYREWPKLPGFERPTLSEGHGRQFVVGYTNEMAASALAERTLPLPDGSVVLLENKPTARRRPESLTVMSKEDGRWHWAKLTPKGRVAVEDGRPVEGFESNACVTCHDKASATDWLFHFPFDTSASAAEPEQVSRSDEDTRQATPPRASSAASLPLP